MQSQDSPIAHFEAMKRLGESLKELPAQILDHEYRGESFGSWSLTIRYEGVVAQLTFDGRNDSLDIKRSADRKPPYTYGRPEAVDLVGGLNGLDDAAVKQICSSIVSS